MEKKAAKTLSDSQVRFEDLLGEPRRTMESVFDHIGVGSDALDEARAAAPRTGSADAPCAEQLSLRTPGVPRAWSSDCAG